MLNIGGEGQLAAGGLAGSATALALPNLPSIVLIPLVLLAGAAGGAAWGAIAGFLKAYFNVNEILSTIMLNLVAVQVMNYLLAGPMVDKTQNSTYGLIPETRLLPHNSWLPILIHGTQLHLGVLIAVVVAVAAYVLLWRTSFGFRLRAVGISREAANYAGIHVKRTMTVAMALSGAMCGLGGSMLVFGSIAHRMVTDGSLTGFTGSDGFNGIVVALFGALSPLWTIVSAFLFGGLLVGGDALQVATGVPADMVTALEGLVVVFVVSLEYMRRRARASGSAPPVATRLSPIEPTGAPVVSAGPFEAGLSGRASTWAAHRGGRRAMSQFLTYAALTSTVAAAIALAASFLFAALGETMGQRSGVINLGVDGIMLLSAFGTYYAAIKTGSLFYAVLVGAGVGLVMGVVTAFISVTLKAEQGISGIGIYLFGLGFSDLLFLKLVGTPLPIAEPRPIDIPLLDKIPALGPMFFKQSLLTYLAFLLVPVLCVRLEAHDVRNEGASRRRKPDGT